MASFATTETRVQQGGRALNESGVQNSLRCRADFSSGVTTAGQPTASNTCLSRSVCKRRVFANMKDVPVTRFLDTSQGARIAPKVCGDNVYQQHSKYRWSHELTQTEQRLNRDTGPAFNLPFRVSSHSY